MASVKKNPQVDDDSPSHGVFSSKYQTHNYGDASDINRDVQHQVLKEKMPNNNIILSYDHGDWISQINEAEVIDAASDFIDVRDEDAYDNKLGFSHSKDVKYDALQNSKRKIRTRSDNEATNLTCNLLPTNPWIAASVKKNVPYESKQVLPDSGSDGLAQRQVKLPQTPNKVKVPTKKQSPPVHRVLLYSSQSPRPSRITSSSLRLQELRRSRNKMPSVTAKAKLVSCNNLGQGSETNNAECNVRMVSDAMSPLSVARIKPNTLKSSKATVGPPKLYTDDIDYVNNDDYVSSDDDDNDDLDNVSDFGDSCDSTCSTDSEDGYRSHAYKLTHSLERVAATQSYLSSQTSEESLVNPDNLLVPSLFPNVPPYLSFSSNTRKGPTVPPELYRVLKWRVTNVMPKVVRLVLANSGMRLLKKTNDWMGIWGKHMKSPCFKTIRPYQKINHLPGSFKIGRKDACWKNLLRQMNKHGKKDFGFMPKTYVIPNDLNMLRKNWPKYAQRNVKWIIKPPASARGAGIRVVNRWAQIPKRKPLIVQRYIERPLLINGSKFDLRLYVLVTSVNPLRVFMYQNGLARFASVKYSDKADTLNDRCMHLTNYSINKFSSNYSKNEDVNACHGHKWTIKSLWTYLANRGIRTDFLWEALRNLVLRTILAGEQSISNMIKMNVESKYSCFELFGFDVLLDADLIPWLLEVNISPSLHSELPLDAHVKAPLVQSVLNTALFNVPPKLSLEKQKEIAAEMSLSEGPICYDKRLYINYLSRAEKIKHNTYTRKTMEDRDEYINVILDNLTPDDVRCLIVAEDELARSAPLERIFPTSQTHKYLKYTDSPRYYNRLLDAWENRYGKNRSEGIALLRDYCEDKYHLEVPPAPAKKQLKYRTRTIMAMRPTRLALIAVARSSVKWKRSRKVSSSASCNKSTITSDNTDDNSSSEVINSADEDKN